MRARRGFASLADLTPSEHVPPGSNHVRAFEAFTLHKLLGDRLGYAWRIEETKKEGTAAAFHFDQPIVRMRCRSPFLSSRFAEVDFVRHSLLLVEAVDEAVTEATYREAWARKLEAQGFGPGEVLVELLERRAIEVCCSLFFFPSLSFVVFPGRFSGAANGAGRGAARRQKPLLGAAGAG